MTATTLWGVFTDRETAAMAYERRYANAFCKDKATLAGEYIGVKTTRPNLAFKKLKESGAVKVFLNGEIWSGE